MITKIRKIIFFSYSYGNCFSFVVHSTLPNDGGGRFSSPGSPGFPLLTNIRFHPGDPFF